LIDVIRKLAGLGSLLRSPVFLLLQLNFKDSLKRSAGLRVLKLHLSDILAENFTLGRSRGAKLGHIVSVQVGLHQAFLREQRLVLHHLLCTLKHFQLLV
jgi:hypothetical protein